MCCKKGHKANECKNSAVQTRNKALLLEEDEICAENTMSELEAIQEEEAVELGEDTKGEEGLMLVTRKTLLTPKFKAEKEGLRGNIFCTTCSIQNRVCNLIIDGGSCENTVSQEVVDKLMLKTTDHPQPYKLSWLKRKGVL